jgi:hypothetical protein
MQQPLSSQQMLIYYSADIFVYCEQDNLQVGKHDLDRLCEMGHSEPAQETPNLVQGQTWRIGQRLFGPADLVHFHPEFS